MNLTDEGIAIGVKKFSDSTNLMKILTKDNGIYSGLIRIKKNQGNSGVNIPGNTLSVNWRARLSEHLGFFNTELIKSRSSNYLNSSINLEVLNSICSLMDIFPEREECIDLYNIIEELLDNLNNTRLWPFLYIKFELLFIERMGYGLDLSSCAVNGSTDNLNWVSPKTGRAVSALGAKGWEDRLLKLPEFLGQNEIKSVSKADLLDSLKLTEFFLIKRVYSQYAKNLSSSRKRMFDYLSDDSFII
ncbi:MAG: DNA repair protein RecO [Hyphomicrobiales bacterium]|jgi:DNA repair protein RecO (recombination protein O)|nr:DNA repair protein RecO [Hyphomicrobiales bacterium]MDG1523690.1 DNA repair protein RecO [Hyphomicrobiales bacterium]MDG1665302.1 DNA repair protein RecO [Hyphomicrobiales bacterium]MDG2413158.1 DNA repair protein RecO [Hyphomicrobiales bacterium]|tara:strand:- start:793 stop:1527 length:735 start_codon:yes stop_codon:yes gene_type:complete